LVLYSDNDTVIIEDSLACLNYAQLATKNPNFNTSINQFELLNRKACAFLFSAESYFGAVSAICDDVLELNEDSEFYFYGNTSRVSSVKVPSSYTVLFYVSNPDENGQNSSNNTNNT
jgi:hypothetical protein